MIGSAAVNTYPDRISATGNTLSFSPLATSDTGSYTCEPTVTEQQTHITIQKPQQNATDITVQSNACIIIIVHDCSNSVLNFHVMWSFHPFPPPVVEVSRSRSGDLYSGTGLSLTCTGILVSNVNSGEHIEI